MCGCVGGCVVRRCQDRRCSGSGDVVEKGFFYSQTAHRVHLVSLFVVFVSKLESHISPRARARIRILLHAVDRILRPLVSCIACS